MSYINGTHRLNSPVITLARVRPYWRDFGLTRCIDITDLDVMGIPTYVGVRPRGNVLQVSSGKGITHENAKCSAVMEALELHHAENPNLKIIKWASENDYCRIMQPRQNYSLLIDSESMEIIHQYYSPNLVQPWIEACDLVSFSKILIPANSTYFMQPGFCQTTTNGLASGNSTNEATLHALYELIERHSISLLSVNGKVKLSTLGRVVDLSSCSSPLILKLLNNIKLAGCDLQLIFVPSELPVYVFMAFILDSSPLSINNEVNNGYGCHADPFIAASRAITEAAQSRLIFIHGSREDIYDKIQFNLNRDRNSFAFRYLRELRPSLVWSQCIKESCLSSLSIDDALDELIRLFPSNGHPIIYRHILECAIPFVSVVKLIVPSMLFNQKLM